MAYVIGMISGTSLDGCDAAMVEIDGESIRLAGFVTLPMPEALHAKILDCCSLERSNIGLTCSLNVEIGHWFARAAHAVCDASGIPMEQVDFIGSHGQTVYHIAEDEGDWVASTLQIGEPAVIAYETGRPVVSNMRAMDMAAGGQGAPMVPFAEYRLYRSETPRALQNLGGIGNVTGLPANAALSDVFAFDTGPANMIINALAKRFYDIEYDDQGKIAATGTVNEALLAEWMAIPYVSAPPPKSTGRELYGAQFVEAALAKHPDIRPEDWLATATRYTAASMELNYRLYVFPRCPAEEIILSGGGAHNLTLRREIEAAFPACRVLTQEDLGWSSDAKEAVAFALMAHETMHGRPSNVPSATGARGPVILGNITPAPWRG
ncbi:anhydro-N-acetylmuramic acid kinase [Eubacteriales bacterium OttesenSCG-928-A19]|nr:anhydro-N-acetylmuramic acid kinase [Eubacteriales bacterium OttesenSCG-928-A19]